MSKDIFRFKDSDSAEQVFTAMQRPRGNVDVLCTNMGIGEQEAGIHATAYFSDQTGAQLMSMELDTTTAPTVAFHYGHSRSALELISEAHRSARAHGGERSIQRPQEQLTQPYSSASIPQPEQPDPAQYPASVQSYSPSLRSGPPLSRSK